MTAPDVGGLVGASGSSTSSNGVSFNSDGTIDFGAYNNPVPVNGGAVSIWNIPQDVITFENSKVGKPFWIGVKAGTGVNVSGNKRFTTEQFQKANDIKAKPDDAYANADQIMASWKQLSFGNPAQQAEFAALQQALANGPWGSISKQELASGGFGIDTERALGNAMDQYIKLVYASGKDGTPVNFLDYIKGEGRPLGPDGKPVGGSGLDTGPTGTPLSLANPADLMQTVQAAAQKALGQNLSQEQLNTFVSQFQQMQQQSYSQAITEGAGQEFTSTPDPTSAAIQFVKQQEPHQFAQNEVRNYADALLNELLSGSSQMPSDNIDQLAGLNG